MSDTAKTNVVGYFNPNTYRVNVAISELNLTVMLEPMQFVMDRQGRKINDPLLDRFVGSKMLSPETSKKPVQIIYIPTTTGPRVPDSRHVVRAGVKSPAGKWQAAPEPPPQAEQEQPPVAKSPTQGMSMDEARRRGLVGRARMVPEDYGAAETDGVPATGQNIPPIRYAVESVAPAAQARATALPKALTEQVRPEMAPVVQKLATVAEADPENVSMDKGTAEAAVREQQGESGVQAFRHEHAHIQGGQTTPSQPPRRVATPVAATAKSTRVARKVAKPVSAAGPAEPAPTGNNQTDPAPESPLMGGGHAVVEEGQEAGDAEQDGGEGEAEETGPGGKTAPLICPACAVPYKGKSQLNRHIRTKHPERAAELIA